MTSYQIFSLTTGHDFGTFEGSTPDEAIAAMAEQAGADVDADDLEVLPILPPAETPGESIAEWRAILLADIGTGDVRAIESRAAFYHGAIVKALRCLLAIGRGPEWAVL